MFDALNPIKFHVLKGMKILYTQIGNILHNLRHLTTSYKYFRRKQIMKNYNQSNQNTNTGVNNTMLNSNNSFAERFKNKGGTC